MSPFPIRADRNSRRDASMLHFVSEQWNQLDTKLQTALISAAVSATFSLGVFFFGPRFSRWRFGPKIKLQFNSGIECLVVSDIDNFLRIKVTGVGTRPAKNCRAYLASVHEISDGKLKQCAEYYDFLQLVWSWTREKAEFEDKPSKPLEITLPQGVSDYVDVLQGDKKDGDTLRLASVCRTLKYDRLIQPKTKYVLQVVVSADDADSQSISIQVCWSGDVCNVTASEFRP